MDPWPKVHIHHELHLHGLILWNEKKIGSRALKSYHNKRVQIKSKLHKSSVNYIHHKKLLRKKWLMKKVLKQKLDTLITSFTFKGDENWNLGAHVHTVQI